jgi:hypothetical protein
LETDYLWETMEYVPSYFEHCYMYGEQLLAPIFSGVNELSMTLESPQTDVNLPAKEYSTAIERRQN